MNPTDFESRARDSARTRLAELQRDKPIAFYEDCYVHAAQWSRTETIAEILTMLRSKPYEGSWTEVEQAGWIANWLERELQKDAPKAKEGCYSDYQNG